MWIKKHTGDLITIRGENEWDPRLLAEKFVACESEWAADLPGRTDETSATSGCPPVRYSHGNPCRPVRYGRQIREMRGLAEVRT